MTKKIIKDCTITTIKALYIYNLSTLCERRMRSVSEQHNPISRDDHISSIPDLGGNMRKKLVCMDEELARVKILATNFNCLYMFGLFY